MQNPDHLIMCLFDHVPLDWFGGMVRCYSSEAPISLLLEDLGREAGPTCW